MADVADEHQTLLQAAAEGIGVMFSSGDDGDEVANTGTRQADYPASDPLGHRGRRHGAGRRRKDNGYGFEQGWGTGKSTLDQRRLDPSLAGLPLRRWRRHEPAVRPAVLPEGRRPGRRSPTTSARAPHRAVPDVAMVGDPNTGFLVGQSQTFPDGTVKYSEYRIGGTSLSSPAVRRRHRRRQPGRTAARSASSTRSSTPWPAPRRSATSTTAARSPTAWSASTTSTASTQGRPGHVAADAQPDRHASTPARATTTSPASAAPTAPASSTASAVPTCTGTDRGSRTDRT